MNRDEELFLVQRPSDNKWDENLYWCNDGEWLLDPKFAIRFTKIHGIFQVGEILVENRLVTRLVPLSEVPSARNPSPPNNGFVVITNYSGNIVCHYPSTVNVEHVLEQCASLNRDSHPSDIPYSAWKQDVGGFTRLFDSMKENPTRQGEKT
jgi:hypothetical protein